ncbi:hypothetical protein [Planktotalea sp.]|uniref:hypothetical protein n=1 Tax=Planktotalea sp. TaxID=2029877 RepID=UPI003D6A6931
MTNVDTLPNTPLLPIAPRHLNDDKDQSYCENDHALVVMFGICLLISIGFWVALFTWLF